VRFIVDSHEGADLTVSGPGWIDELIRAQSRPAYAFALALTGRPDIAEEFVQEAFVRAWQSAKTPREIAPFRGWIYRTILNLARDRHRRASRWNRIPWVPRPAADPAQIAEGHIGDAALITALHHLSRREREAVALRYFEDLSYADISAVLGVRDSTARVLVNRALNKLRVRLGALGMALPEAQL
jgi:RNA polymerase sigma-70 factor, ECF subfamily